MQDFLTDLMPYVENHYRISTDRSHRAIAGLSMGGGHTLNIGFPQLSKFSHIGVFSSGGGANKDWETRNMAVLDFRESPGGHTWINWQTYPSQFAPLLFQ